MSQTRRDVVDAERLISNEIRPRSTQITAVQSSTMDSNLPTVVVFDVSSTAAMVNFLPAEGSSEGKVFEVYVLDTNSGTLYLKNTSGDVKAIVPPGGYARLACLKSVWRAGAGNAFGTFSGASFGAALTPGFTSVTSAVGFSSIAEAEAFVQLVYRMRDALKARGIGV